MTATSAGPAAGTGGPGLLRLSGSGTGGGGANNSMGLPLPLGVDVRRTLTFHSETYTLTLRLERTSEAPLMVLEAVSTAASSPQAPAASSALAPAGAAAGGGVVEEEGGAGRWPSPQRVWRGQFTQQYVEAMAAKTGSARRFPVFIKMLLAALRPGPGAAAGADGGGVFLNVLTYRDLELLKARRSQPQPAAASAPTSAARVDKRYLILTHASEFERVHYPLPLHSVAHHAPAPSDDEHSLPTTSGDDRSSSHRRRQRTRTLSSAPSASSLTTATAPSGELASLRQALEEAVEDYKLLQRRSQREVAALRAEVLALKRRRGEEEGRRRVGELETALDRERRRGQQLQLAHKREMASLLRRLETETSATRVLQSRNRELQRRLAEAEAVLKAAAIRRRQQEGMHARRRALSASPVRAGAGIGGRATGGLCWTPPPPTRRRAAAAAGAAAGSGAGPSPPSPALSVADKTTAASRAQSVASRARPAQGGSKRERPRGRGYYYRSSADEWEEDGGSDGGGGFYSSGGERGCGGRFSPYASSRAASPAARRRREGTRSPYASSPIRTRTPASCPPSPSFYTAPTAASQQRAAETRQLLADRRRREERERARPPSPVVSRRQKQGPLPPEERHRHRHHHRRRRRRQEEFSVDEEEEEDDEEDAGDAWATSLRGRPPPSPAHSDRHHHRRMRHHRARSLSPSPSPSSSSSDEGAAPASRSPRRRRGDQRSRQRRREREWEREQEEGEGRPPSPGSPSSVTSCSVAAAAWGRSMDGAGGGRVEDKQRGVAAAPRLSQSLPLQQPAAAKAEGDEDDEVADARVAAEEMEEGLCSEKEIGEIDRRLAALQAFLSQAQRGTVLGGGGRGALSHSA